MTARTVSRPSPLVPRLAGALLLKLLLAGALAGPAEVRAQSWKTVTSSRQVTDEDELRVRVRYGAGVLKVQRGEAGLLYRVLFRFDEEFAEPDTEYENGLLEVGMSMRERRRLDLAGRSSEASLELELPGDVPLDIELDFGAGRAELDLTGLPVRHLELNTGASESVIHIDEPNPERMESASVHVGAADLRIRGVGNLNADEVTVKAGLGSVALELDGEWPQGAVLSIEMGLGALEIRVPKSLGVRLHHRKSFLTSIDADGFVKKGNTYHSVNWDGAERRVDIEITAALGSIEVVWIE